MLGRVQFSAVAFAEFLVGLILNDALHVQVEHVGQLFGVAGLELRPVGGERVPQILASLPCMPLRKHLGLVLLLVLLARVALVALGIVVKLKFQVLL